MNLEVEVEKDIRRDGLGTAVAVTIDTRPVATVFTALGARGKPAEVVAEEAVDQVCGYMKGRRPSIAITPISLSCLLPGGWAFIVCRFRSDAALADQHCGG